MYKIRFKTNFKRTFKKWSVKHRNLKSNFYETLKKLEINPRDPSLETHKLTGNLKGLWACNIHDKQRLVFELSNDKKQIDLSNIGSHDEVY